MHCSPTHAGRFAERVVREGRAVARALDREQRATHGLAWFATYVEALRQLASYVQRLSAIGNFGEVEELLVRIGADETWPQIVGGISDEPGRDRLAVFADLGLGPAAAAARMNPAVEHLIAYGNTAQRRARLAELMRERQEPTIGDDGLDETLEAMRKEMRRFADEEVVPHAHGWHLKNQYIPLEIVAHMAELGVFGLTIPEEYGGLGLGKESMCVVSDELSRGYIGVGSLGTRSEIAAELILGSGTDAQKKHWLPKIASGEVLPTAVFTEPNTGSDLASLKTRAVREGDVYKIYGNKTWITHPVRADLMTLLRAHQPKRVRLQGPVDAAGAEAARHRQRSVPGAGHDRRRNRSARLSRHEGIRDRLRRLRSAGGKSPRRRRGPGLQATDADLRGGAHPDRRACGRRRAIGDGAGAPLRRSASSSASRRFLPARRRQDRDDGGGNHDRPPAHLSRRAQKDSGRRCDLEAGMAKLYAARVAWAAADNAVQIHGGNGFALEYPVSRVLCDARILNIFEGAAEIQAQVIARRRCSLERQQLSQARVTRRTRLAVLESADALRPCKISLIRRRG